MTENYLVAHPKVVKIAGKIYPLAPLDERRWKKVNAITYGVLHAPGGTEVDKVFRGMLRIVRLGAPKLGFFQARRLPVPEIERAFHEIMAGWGL